MTKDQIYILTFRRLFSFFFAVFIACIADEFDQHQRGIYLVLLEGDPVAFHQDALLANEGKRPGPKR